MDGFKINTHVVIVVTPNVMCQFMAQHLPNLLVAPESVVPISTDAELDRLSLVNVQTQQVWVLVWGEFRQQSDREFV